MRFLAEQHLHYYGKAQELKEAVTGWLSFIPASFPHYTRHTVEHSEEIISQMSKLLFINGNVQKPVLQELSGIEAYILVAAAYLHDAGMTVPDSEKVTILQSPEWKAWVEDGSGATRYGEIQAFRAETNGSMDAITRQFLVDVQLRFLIAEYVRRTHHLRGGDILSLHQDKIGRFGYDDPILIQTISSVCVAHGLQQHELNDPERFPERRDVRDEQVNVRLLAVMLRLGDLLDMSYDRACPLLLNAASPIPPDSLAHWTQYQRITHKLVAHDKIELTAACQNEEEHRFLHDWCAWLVSELDQARRLMVRSARHADWVPPIAAIDQASNNTITIKPALGARYIPARWRFELDTKAVFDRLIYDALDTPWDFLRELIQNAADATRCRMFADLQEQEGSAPQYPTQVAEHIRNTYPIRITLSSTEIRNELSGEMEQRQILTVEDIGIGMDRDVIQKYLLQVGRSFYTTREFRNAFGFVASSRFGIGFLSVFGVSDDVTIETYKPSSNLDPTALKLRLTGPRSYLLTEKGDRRIPGTSIKVVLRESVVTGKVVHLIKEWCGRLEFPLLIDELGLTTELRAEKIEDFIDEAPDLTKENSKIVVRAFPINREGIEGELFVLSSICGDYERWDIDKWTYLYKSQYPQAVVPELPRSSYFFHGINSANPHNRTRHARDGFSLRVDLRGERFQPSLTRSDSRFQSSSDYYDDISARWDEILREHLDTTAAARGEEGWAYKQRLFDSIGSFDFWLDETNTIVTTKNGVDNIISLRELDSVHLLQILVPITFSSNKPWLDKETIIVYKDNNISIHDSILDSLSNGCRSYIFQKRKLEKIEILNDLIICSWAMTEDVQERGFASTIIPIEIDLKFIGGEIHLLGRSSTDAAQVINMLHPFGKWYLAVKDACDRKMYGLEKKHIEQINTLLRTPLRFRGNDIDRLSAYLDQWCKLPNLPAELVPNNIELKSSEFSITYQNV